MELPLCVPAHARPREERRRDLAAARRAGGARHAAARRQRGGRGTGRGDHAHRRRAHLERHRLGRVRDPVGRPAPGRAQRLGARAGGVDARALRGTRCDAAARMGLGDGARVRVGLGHAVQALRQASLRGALRARHPLRARKLHGLADHRVELGAAGAGPQGVLGVLLDLPAQGPRALSGRALLLPAAGRDAGGHRRDEGRELLPRGARRAHRARQPLRRRRDDAGRPGRSRLRLGRPDLDRLPRLPAARDAAERAGHRRARRARDAAPPRRRRLRARFRRQPAPADRGDEARVRRRLAQRRGPGGDAGPARADCSTTTTSPRARGRST